MKRIAAVLITTTFACQTLDAQQPADSLVTRNSLSDSILATGTTQGWLRRERGIDVGTLDARRGAFTTAPSLALALQARLPGVSVTQGEGLVGSTSQLLLRGPASFRVHEPLLIIDGARTHASQEDRGDLHPLPSRLEHLDPDIIERVEILRGAAASAIYGPGASRGVILVTTKRGAPGPLRWTGFAESGPLIEVTKFPANFATSGATAGGATLPNCPLADQATGLCTPIATQSWNPLESASPFRTGWSSSAGLGVSGGSATFTYHATGSAEGASGVYEADRGRTFNGHLDIGLAATQSIDLRFTGGYRIERFRRPTGGYIQLGLFGDAADDPIRHGYDDVEGFLTGPLREVGRHDLGARRINGSLDATWHPTAGLRASALIGYDDLRLNDDFRERHARFPASVDSVTTIQRSKDKPAARTAAIRVERSFGYRGTSARTAVGGDYFRDDERARALEQFYTDADVPVSESRITVDRRREDYGAYIQQHLARGPLAITGSMRVDLARGPFATTYSPSVDASWLALDGARPGEHTVGDLRVRGAWARGGGHIIQTGELDNSFFGGHPSEEMAERASELELGADGSLFATRLRWSVTGYRALHDQAIITIPVSGGSGQLVTNDGRIVTRGLESSIDARAVDNANVAWDVGVIVSAHRSEIRTRSGRQFYNPGDYIPSRESIGEYHTELFTFNDANGDGLIEPNELTVKPGGFPSRGSPFPSYEAALRSDALIGGRVRVSAILDHRGGQERIDEVGAARCQIGNCEAQHDRGTSLARQAAAVGARRGSTWGWIEDATYTRLREVTVAMALPQAWTGSVTSARMTLTGRNLATWTSFGGLDPEVVRGEVNVVNAAGGFLQPPLRTFALRLDLAW